MFSFLKKKKEDDLKGLWAVCFKTFDSDFLYKNGWETSRVFKNQDDVAVFVSELNDAYEILTDITYSLVAKYNNNEARWVKIARKKIDSYCGWHQIIFENKDDAIAKAEDLKVAFSFIIDDVKDYVKVTKI